MILGTLFIPYPVRDLLRLLPDMNTKGDPYKPDMRLALQSYMSSVNPLDVSLKVLPNLTAGHVAIHFDLQGACRTVSDAATGGMHAIAQAVTAIREERLDLAFCGGTEVPLEDMVFADLCATDLLASPRGEPGPTCRPFGRGRAGLVAGEGAAILVLEALDHAEARGASFRAEVLGFGAASGGSSVAQRGASCGRAMAAALEESGLDEVDLIAANGDSSRANDLAEAAALRGPLTETRNHSAIYATKGAHGDLFSAAGPLGVATAILALERGLVPPSANCDDPDPDCGLALSGPAPSSRPGARSALVNALGAFGEAASLVVARAE